MTNKLEILRDRPHVVILGAGASVATIPNGDKYGRKISVMDGFIDNLGLRGILSGIEFESENLEDIYIIYYNLISYLLFFLKFDKRMENLLNILIL